MQLTPAERAKVFQLTPGEREALLLVHSGDAQQLARMLLSNTLAAQHALELLLIYCDLITTYPEGDPKMRNMYFFLIGLCGVGDEVYSALIDSKEEYPAISRLIVEILASEFALVPEAQEDAKNTRLVQDTKFPSWRKPFEPLLETYATGEISQVLPPAQEAEMMKLGEESKKMEAEEEEMLRATQEAEQRRMQMLSEAAMMEQLAEEQAQREEAAQQQQQEMIRQQQEAEDEAIRRQEFLREQEEERRMEQEEEERKRQMETAAAQEEAKRQQEEEQTAEPMSEEEELAQMVPPKLIRTTRQRQPSKYVQSAPSPPRRSVRKRISNVPWTPRPGSFFF